MAEGNDPLELVLDNMRKLSKYQLFRKDWRGGAITAIMVLEDYVLGSSNEFHFVHRGLAGARPKRSIPHMRRLKVDPLVHIAVQMPGFKRVKRGYKPLRVENLVPDMKPERDPTDPFFQFQWYLKNTGQNGGKAKLDLNVEAAWAQGVTGKNVTTAIMDDGE
ncbi:unnamed protein product [Nezara viridula]|uniref:Peptidase S8 pro-domain domain-containing protein n=1 Tax=Nezara viridula TaxID=85310 RepID=A0A9P0EB07_NEZVI|nr:unnamed protein product [Nezara viridula]